MKVSVLFVCMGNICRSPTAHGVFRQQVAAAGLSDQIVIDSAGTHGYHIGNPPDARATATALQRGIEMGDLRARQVNTSDFTQFDYILAMDIDNLRLLRASCSGEEEHRLSLMLDWTTGWGDIKITDNTKGAVFYYAHNLVYPTWADQKEYIGVLGNHTFMK